MRALLRSILILIVVAAFPLCASAVQNGNFDLTFNGVTYNYTDVAQGIGTSTWSYTLVWNGEPHALSHFTIGLCDNPAAELVGETTPPGASIGPDGSTGLFGIKWEFNDDFPANRPVTFSFTLSRPYAVTMTSFITKAGSVNDNFVQIEGPGCDIARPAISIDKSCAADVWLGDSIEYTITVTNSGNVPLANVMLSDPLLSMNENLGTIAAGASVTRTGTISASDRDVSTIVNGASVGGDYYGYAVSDSDDCTTAIHQLQVSKTATTHYDRDHDWVVTKHSNTQEGSSVEICSGNTGSLPFTIEATRSTHDSGFNVSGQVVVFNPAPIAASIANLTDTLSGFGPVALDCGSVSFPASLAGGASIVCSYSQALDDASSRTNVARATLMNLTAFEGSAAVEFGAPDNVSDASISVSDSVNCPEEFTCGGAGPFSFDGSGSISFEISATNTSATCDTNYTVSNIASWSDDGTSHSTAAASTNVYSCTCATGCTLTIGYWKTHAGFTGNNADRVTQYLPIWLGVVDGPKSKEVTTAAQAVNVLSMNVGDPSNGITKLYAQLLAAKLNMANGADIDDISKVMNQADAFLANNNETNWASLSKSQRNTVVKWMAELDLFNNGLLGPGHCD